MKSKMKRHGSRRKAERVPAPTPQQAASRHAMEEIDKVARRIKALDDLRT